MVNFLAFLFIAIPVFAFINFIDIERTRRRIRHELEAEDERNDELMELFGDMKDNATRNLKPFSINGIKKPVKPKRKRSRRNKRMLSIPNFCAIKIALEQCLNHVRKPKFISVNLSEI